MEKLDAGIAICGSGNGVCMTANKHQGIRAALVWQSDLAALSRQHNNANVVCIPARFVDYALAEEMVSTFLITDFEGGRHERRGRQNQLSITKNHCSNCNSKQSYKQEFRQVFLRQITQ